MLYCTKISLSISYWSLLHLIPEYLTESFPHYSRQNIRREARFHQKFPFQATQSRFSQYASNINLPTNSLRTTKAESSKRTEAGSIRLGWLDLRRACWPPCSMCLWADVDEKKNNNLFWFIYIYWVYLSGIHLFPAAQRSSFEKTRPENRTHGKLRMLSLLCRHVSGTRWTCWKDASWDWWCRFFRRFIGIVQTFVIRCVALIGWVWMDTVLTPWVGQLDP